MMKCFVCSKEIPIGYLCKQHTLELSHRLDSQEGLIDRPDWRYHCEICGEYRDRIILELKDSGYFCDKCIREAKDLLRKS